MLPSDHRFVTHAHCDGVRKGRVWGGFFFSYLEWRGWGDKGGGKGQNVQKKKRLRFKSLFTVGKNEENGEKGIWKLRDQNINMMIIKLSMMSCKIFFGGVWAVRIHNTVCQIGLFGGGGRGGCVLTFKWCCVCTSNISKKNIYIYILEKKK